MESTNQQNAQHSTGPRTEPGKRRSSMNAFRHGLTGQTILMPGEDIAPYQAFCKRAFDELKPQGLLEEIAVQTIADSSWRLNRARTYESSLFPQDADNRETHSELTKSLTNLSTYEQRLNRTLERATQALTELQQVRRDAETKVLEEAKAIGRYFKMKKIEWSPQEDGFVFTTTELDALIRHEDRATLCAQEVKWHYQAIA